MRAEAADIGLTGRLRVEKRDIREDIDITGVLRLNFDTFVADAAIAQGSIRRRGNSLQVLVYAGVDSRPARGCI